MGHFEYDFRVPWSPGRGVRVGVAHRVPCGRRTEKDGETWWGAAPPTGSPHPETLPWSFPPCPQGSGTKMGLDDWGLTVALAGSDATLLVLKVHTGLGQPPPIRADGTASESCRLALCLQGCKWGTPRGSPWAAAMAYQLMTADELRVRNWCHVTSFAPTSFLPLVCRDDKLGFPRDHPQGTVSPLPLRGAQAAGTRRDAVFPCCLETL